MFPQLQDPCDNELTDLTLSTCTFDQEETPAFLDPDSEFFTLVDPKMEVDIDELYETLLTPKIEVDEDLIIKEEVCSSPGKDLKWKINMIKDDPLEEACNAGIITVEINDSSDEEDETYSDDCNISEYSNPCKSIF